MLLVHTLPNAEAFFRFPADKDWLPSVLSDVLHDADVALSLMHEQHYSMCFIVRGYIVGRSRYLAAHILVCNILYFVFRVG